MEDVLAIEVASEMVPNLVLVDLPGIAAANLQGEVNIMEQTRILTSKYLQMPSTLVLAVVDARTRIRNSQAIQLVQSYRKESQCLGVLTKADLCYDPRTPDDPYHQLREKLDGQSADYIHLPMVMLL